MQSAECYCWTKVSTGFMICVLVCDLGQFASHMVFGLLCQKLLHWDFRGHCKWFSVIQGITDCDIWSQGKSEHDTRWHKWHFSRHWLRFWQVNRWNKKSIIKKKNWKLKRMLFNFTIQDEMQIFTECPLYQATNFTKTNSDRNLSFCRFGRRLPARVSCTHSSW